MVVLSKKMVFFAALLCLLLSLSAAGARFRWEVATPESQGLSSKALDALQDSLAHKNTKALLVIRHDKIVYEWYASGHGPDKKHYTASLAKALVGGMSLMTALHDGRISIDDPAWKYIPQWKNHPLKSKITIRHLATHSAGVEDAEQDNIPHVKLPGWKGAFWRKDPDPFTLSRDKAPIVFTPGAEYAYSNPGMAMLSYAVTAGLHDSKHTDIRTLLRERLMRPIGIKDNEWSIGYGKTYEVDGLELVANWGGGSYTARAIARVGRLMLRGGNWQGKQLINPKQVKEMVGYAGTPLPDRSKGNPQPASGLCWWTNFDGIWAKTPRDAFAGAGAGNQVLLVVPSLDLIVVRNGGNLYDQAKGEGFWGGLEKYLFNPLMDSFISLPASIGSQISNAAPYPASPLIKKVIWASKGSILRKAKGSDNWPMTWADDGNLYTTYGDGLGFDPKVPAKLGLGFAKITGYPPHHNGINIRSLAENTGSGRKGKKGSGILMVNGVLYLWLFHANRNGAEAQLAWSEDYAQTWTFADWKFTEFGLCTFINYGKNYDGARDRYVYVVSHDGPQADTPADSFVLMRASQNRIVDRKAYEFFQGIDPKGHPVWTKNIDMRGPVFQNPGRCLRSSIVYNESLRRYLWWQQVPNSRHPGHDQGDTRFEGGFGIYDAPEPWGPWTTVFFTEKWDVGPGERAGFPTKWMSGDGRTCHLVFSGDDCFSVRKVTFEVASDK